MLALIATATAKSIMDAPQSWRQALAKIVDSPQHTAASRSVDTPAISLDPMSQFPPSPAAQSRSFIIHYALQ
jgi:hypothetical protein